MRQGRLLAEESPQDLISKFRADTLEEVFLELSRRQVEGTLPPQEFAPLAIESNPSVTSSVTTLQENGSTNFLTEKLKREKKKSSALSINPDRLKALFLKNWLQFIRNYGGVAFSVIFPLVQMTVFFLAIGGDPKNLPLAFVNDENGTCENFNLDNYIYFNNESECEFRHLSCKFMDMVEDPMIYKVGQSFSFF